MHRPRIALLAAFLACAPVAHAADTTSGPDAETVLSPRQQAAQDRVDAFRAGLARSSDPRLRVVGSWISAFARAPVSGVDDSTRATATESATALNDGARGSTDPLLLDLLSHRCGIERPPTQACDPVDLARRWTVADTQNQLAWLTLASALRGAHDDEAARAAFLRASAASRWHEHAWDAMRVLVDATPRDFAPLERLGWTTAASALAFAAVWPDYQLLLAYCREGGRNGDPSRAACLRIADTMMRDGASLMTLTLAPTLAAFAGAQPSVVASYQQRADAIHWAAMQTMPYDASRDEETSQDPDDAAARALPRWASIVAASERERAERYLVEHHLREADAAGRYAESLPTEVRRSRARRLADARAWVAGATPLSAGSTRSTAASP